MAAAAPGRGRAIGAVVVGAEPDVREHARAVGDGDRGVAEPALGLEREDARALRVEARSAAAAARPRAPRGSSRRAPARAARSARTRRARAPSRRRARASRARPRARARAATSPVSCSARPTIVTTTAWPRPSVAAASSGPRISDQRRPTRAAASRLPVEAQTKLSERRSVAISPNCRPCGATSAACACDRARPRGACSRCRRRSPRRGAPSRRRARGGRTRSCGGRRSRSRA